MPRPGAIVASGQMPVTGDSLNHFTFSVKVIADSAVKSGVYDVEAAFGPNIARGRFVMPKGGAHLKPIMHKGATPYTYIIGFKVDNDTTFYDYFKVQSNHMTTQMQYTKAYTL